MWGSNVHVTAHYVTVAEKEAVHDILTMYVMSEDRLICP